MILVLWYWGPTQNDCFVLTAEKVKPVLQRKNKAHKGARVLFSLGSK